MLDARTGGPIDRAAVWIHDSGQKTTTDRDGRFTLADVVPGRRVLFVSAVNYALARREVEAVAGETVDLAIRMVGEAGTYAETVVVVAPARDDGVLVPARQSLDGVELQRLSGGMLEDPVRAFQALPGVTTGDDLRAEFAVRGSGPRNIGNTFEGVSTSLLIHTWHQQDDGSVSMVNGAVMDRMSLSRGAYPQLEAGRTGAWLETSMREGPRDRVETRLSTSLTSSSLVVGGPIGAEGRGSFLLAGRYNYIDKLLRLLDVAGGASAFSLLDSQGKVVYDLASAHQIQAAWVVGRSTLNMEAESEDADPEDDYLTTNSTLLTTAALRSSIAPGLVLTNRVAVVTNHFGTEGFFGRELQQATRHEYSYRGDLAQSVLSRSTLEAGLKVSHASHSFQSTAYWWADATQRSIAPVGHDAFDASASQLGGHVLLRWNEWPRLALSPGLRVDRSSLTQQVVASPWCQTTWSPRIGWDLSAAAAINHQFPDLAQVAGRAGGGPRLRAERAVHLDMAVAHRFSNRIRAQFTVYNRAESNGLRLQNAEIRRIPSGVFLPGQSPARYANALGGYSRGVEVELRAGSPVGLSGWVSYSLGYTRFRDVSTGEMFWGDYDQRHTINAFVQHRLTPRMSLSGRVRFGSNFPLVGYYAGGGGSGSPPAGADNPPYIVSDARNVERLPPYLRVDVRTDRTFTVAGRRMTLYAEVVNLLGRRNERQKASGYWRRPDGQIEYNTPLESMFPVLPVLGMTIEF